MLKSGSVAGLGLWGLHLWSSGATGSDSGFLAEAGWKAVPKNVKAMYAKEDRRFVRNPSTTESEGVRGNPREPSRKAKYYLATDSEAVP